MGLAEHAAQAAEELGVQSAEESVERFVLVAEIAAEVGQSPAQGYRMKGRTFLAREFVCRIEGKNSSYRSISCNRLKLLR